MANRVPDEGRLNARIVLIGEAPDQHEDEGRRPFIGPSGSLLATWWKEVGLQRSDFYLTNVCPVRPPGNDITKIDAHAMAQYVEALHVRLAALDDPWLIVPTGNIALRALTGKTGILKHRGSIYEYVDQRDRHIKVIPTVHPAATYREPTLTRSCRADWRRIAADAEFRELRLPAREHYIAPDIEDLHVYAQSVDNDGVESIALDIETPGGKLTCIGFSYDPAFSITIPTTEAYWDGQYQEALRVIQQILAGPAAKVMQNGLFDSYYLRWLGFVVTNWQYDTLAMHHCLCPNDHHDLAYMASVDTREPYWKDEAKDPQEMKKYTSNQQAFWTYNGKDVAVTKELQETYYDRLDSAQRIPFYQRHYRNMFEPLLSMSLGGMRLDGSARDRRYEELQGGCNGLLERLHTLAGEPLHAKTGLSPIRLQRFMYQTLGLPVQRKRGGGGVTTDEVAVRRLMRRYPDKFGTAGRLILDFRGKAKQAQFLAKDIADEDGRVRCQYRFTTETGRLSSSSNPRGTGTNLQNQDRSIMDIYVPDEGQVFMGLDLSQAEDRWVKVIAYANRNQVKPVDCQWEELLWRARSKPWENDEHWRAAEAIYGLPRDQMDKATHRQLGKKTRHASNYGMRAATFVENLMKDDVYLTEKEADGILNRLRQADPYIEVYQKTRRLEVASKRRLVNTWGRIYYFDYDRMDDDTFRRAYAFQPQAEVADVTNQLGIIVAHLYIKEHGLKSRLVAQKHDEIVLSVPIDEAWRLYSVLKKSLEQPRTYRDIELSVPVDVWVGRNWGEHHEWKMPPSQAELESAIEELL